MWTCTTSARGKQRGKRPPTLPELLDATKLSGVVPALGGPPVKHGRCSAFWRDGHNPTAVSIDDERGLWFDFAAAEGGGVLDLIARVRSCSRREAAVWLAQYHGVELGNAFRPPRHAEQFHLGVRQADDLTAWRFRRLVSLIEERNRLWDSELMVSAAARVFGENPGDEDEEAWDIIWESALDDQRGDAIDAEIRALEAMGPLELAAYRAKLEALV